MTDGKELKDQRIPIMMTETEVIAIDDWAFSHRIRSRGEAIRRLCQMGLALDKQLKPLFEAFKGFGERFVQTGDAAARLIDPSEADRMEAVKELTAAQVEAVAALIKLQLAIRELTGKGYALKSDQPLEAVLADAREIGEMFQAASSRMQEAIEGSEKTVPAAPQWDWENAQADPPPPIPKPKSGQAKRQKR